MVTIHHFLKSQVRQAQLDELGAIDRAEGIFWIDLEDATTEEEKAVLVDRFKIPPSVLDVVRQNQVSLPRLEDHFDFLFIISNVVVVGDAGEQAAETQRTLLDRNQLNIFLFPRVLVTHHRKPVKTLEYVRALYGKNPELSEKGSDGLLSLLLDSVMDDFVPVLSRMGYWFESFEDQVMVQRGSLSMQEVLHSRKNVIAIQRITYHHREVLYRLAFRRFVQISEKEQNNFRNTYEHVERFTEIAESFRQGITGLMEAHVSFTSENTNRVMKILTIASTIFLPLSIITGFYGMNLPFLPGANSSYSFIPVTLIMTAIAGIMLFVFKRQKWL